MRDNVSPTLTLPRRTHIFPVRNKNDFVSHTVTTTCFSSLQSSENEGLIRSTIRFIVSLFLDIPIVLGLPNSLLGLAGLCWAVQGTSMLHALSMSPTGMALIIPVFMTDWAYPDLGSSASKVPD